MEPFFADFYVRLSGVHEEIDRTLADLPREALDWSPGPEMNTPAVLVAHIAGAERYLMGDVIAVDPSNREREAEFATAGKDGAELREMLAATLAYSRAVLERLTPADLSELRTSPRSGQSHTVAWTLLHALDHTAEHMAHLQMTRQLWQQQQTRGLRAG